METRLKILTNEALGLEVEQKAELAHILISSLDEKPRQDVGAVWDVELKRRIHEIREGKVKGVPADEVFAKLRRKYVYWCDENHSEPG